MLHTLGDAKITHMGASYPLKPMEVALLSYVCLSPDQRTTRSEAADLLWAGSSPKKARQSLSQLIYQLKRLPLHLLVAERNLLVAQLPTDVGSLRQAFSTGDYNSAIALYQGRFLACDKYPAEFLEWRDSVESQTKDFVALALERLIPRAADSELPSLIEVAERLLRTHPHAESTTSQLLIALIRSGQVDRAKHHHQRFTSDMGPGMIPSFDLYLQTEQTFKGQGSASRSHTTSVPFIGRASDLSDIHVVWNEASHGRGGTVLLSGEPGIGKTRLALHALRRIALSGGRIWTVRCSAATQRLPYANVADLLRDNYNDASAATAINEDPALRFLTCVDASSGPAMREPRESWGPDEWKHRLLQRLTLLVLDEAKKVPLAIMVDDAHWADDFTLDLLRYWSYRLHRCRVLILLTARTEDGEANREWITSEFPAARHIRVGQLGIKESEELVAAFERDRQFSLAPHARDAVIWQSAGRPFLLIEALGDILARGHTYASTAVVLSESAEVLLRRRFRGLDSESLWVLGILAVYGTPLALEVVTMLADVPARVSASAFEELFSRGIIQWRDGKVAFTHDLMREAAYRQLVPTTRAIVHRTVAAAIAASGGDVGLLAQHYAAGGEADQAGSYALTAARISLRDRAYTDYVYYLELALQHGTTDHREEAALALAKHYVQLGLYDEAERLLPLLPEAGSADEVTLLRTVVNIDRGLTSGSARLVDILTEAQHVIAMAGALEHADLAPVAGVLFDLAADSSHAEFGTQVMRMLVAEADHSNSTDFAVQVAAFSAVWEAVSHGYLFGREMFKGVATPLGASPSQATLAICANADATLHFLGGNLTEADKGYQRAMEYAIRSESIRRQTMIRLNSGVVQLERDDFPHARTNFEVVLASPNTHYKIRALMNLGILHYLSGEWSLAEHSAETVHAMNERYGSSLFDSVAHAMLGLSALRQGDFVEATAREAMLDREQPRLAVDDTSYVVGFRARMCAARGEPALGISLLDEAAAMSASRFKVASLRLLCDKAEILAGHDAHAAYRMAKDLAAECGAAGAHLTQRKAEEILAQCRYYS